MAYGLTIDVWSVPVIHRGGDGCVSKMNTLERRYGVIAGAENCSGRNSADWQIAAPYSRWLRLYWPLDGRVGRVSRSSRDAFQPRSPRKIMSGLPTELKNSTAIAILACARKVKSARWPGGSRTKPAPKACPIEDKEWDAVIDNSGYVPRIVQASTELLAPNVGQYLFISTLSVYADNSQPDERV